MKSCSCKECPNQNPQPYENFSRRNGIADGYQAKCKTCAKIQKDAWYEKNKEAQRANTRAYAAANREQVRESTRKWAKKNPDKVKAYHLRTKYGVSLERYNEMIKDQNNQCAICEQKTEGRDLYVDHCHTTKKVRGLLCVNCNAALGGYKDSIPLLESAIAYLKSHKD